jgi:hypothetical protein
MTIPQIRELHVDWPNLATLAWDGDDLLDVTTGRRMSADGTISKGTYYMPFAFDRAIAQTHKKTRWAACYANRGTKALLFKNGTVHRELNRSYYCANAFDYPIVLAVGKQDRMTVIHCPNEFNLLEIEDADSGEVIARGKSEDMEFHSRLEVSEDSQFLLDSGWFWHPWCSAAVFELKYEEPNSFPGAPLFTANHEIDSAAFLGKQHVVVSAVANYQGENTRTGDLLEAQLGVWSLKERKWISQVDVGPPIGMLMPWREWVVSFYENPKLIELVTGKIVKQWGDIYSGKQIGPIDLGNPAPPPMAIDARNGRFAIATSGGATIVQLTQR